ncbi:DNA polymerase III subunit chi [Rhodobacter ferrooxidans]|uniref:DNA polymerase III chi subunit HolC n=1 Tax=Rhodobacter ferrooxidans TaxID=371731 RepID=C8S3V3_9RHOB|nr:DNA polymerase III subunit chi [Rhodobacter sp. SW2]EEW24322.1 DNA polymerase III chi subunit HolC [Rhodobacter sp. SW2]
MVLVLFYHLTRSPVEATAAGLLSRALDLGWRVMLRGTDPARLALLDERLWLGPEEGFLPHGLQGGPQDADQPVLLGTGAIGNAAHALMLVDGAEPLTGEAEALERVWVLFDGNDPAALETARAQWKTLTAQGLHAKYWSEDSGSWQMKTERNPPD